MYCFKCGKKLDENYNCPNCDPAFKTDIVIEDLPPVESGSRRTGFVPALVGVIMSALALVFFFVADVFVGLLLPGAFDDYYTQKLSLTAGIFLFLTFAFCAVSLFLGIKSIRTFIREKREGRKTPIATLVVGIAGTSVSAITGIAFCFLYGTFLIFC